MNEKYQSQKEYLSKQKQLRVWMSSDKLEEFKALAASNGTSAYALINDFVDDYIKKSDPIKEDFT